MSTKQEPIPFLELKVTGRVEIAKMLKVSRMTLNRWEKHHPIPKDKWAFSTYGKKLTVKELITWLDQLYQKLKGEYSRARYGVQYARRHLLRSAGKE